MDIIITPVLQSAILFSTCRKPIAFPVLIKEPLCGSLIEVQKLEILCLIRLNYDNLYEAVDNVSILLNIKDSITT